MKHLNIFINKIINMEVSILGAGAMGSALTIPLSENVDKVYLWGTEFDLDILKILKKGLAHPRINAKVPEEVEILNPEELEKAVNVDVVVLAVSTEGVIPIFNRIEKFLENQILLTIAKGLVDDGRVMTIPEMIWNRKSIDVVAITGPAIAREVANKLPTRVVMSGSKAEDVANLFRTDYFGVETTDDIIGAEITSAFKNIYSIGIAWIRGYESVINVEMSNAKGVLASMAIMEIANVVAAYGGKKETAYGLSGFGDLIATFRGGRNGMLGELLGKGYSIDNALDELRKMGVGVIEGYVNARRAYKLLQQLENEGRLRIEEFQFIKHIYKVLYENERVEDVLPSLLLYGKA